ncbi:MAG: hypothetical protein Q8L48_37470 [Archangium sp.]|nr:hypothetical protein [Archangium sp.]
MRRWLLLIPLGAGCTCTMQGVNGPGSVDCVSSQESLATTGGSS